MRRKRTPLGACDFRFIELSHAKSQRRKQKDMFGHPFKGVDKHERMLAKIDKATFASRVERLKFVDGITGDLGMLGSMETVFIFREAGWAYIAMVPLFQLSCFPKPLLSEGFMT